MQGAESVVEHKDYASDASVVNVLEAESQVQVTGPVESQILPAWTSLYALLRPEVLEASYLLLRPIESVSWKE